MYWRWEENQSYNLKWAKQIRYNPFNGTKTQITCNILIERRTKTKYIGEVNVFQVK